MVSCSYPGQSGRWGREESKPETRHPAGWDRGPLGGAGGVPAGKAEKGEGQGARVHDGPAGKCDLRSAAPAVTVGLETAMEPGKLGEHQCVAPPG